MAGENRIIAFGAGGSELPPSEPTTPPADEGAPAAPEAGEAEWDQAWVAGAEDDAATREGSRAWVIGAGVAAAAWTALFAAGHYGEVFAGIALAAVPGLVAQWCVPLLLIGLVWLLAMRHSAREGKRFGDVARQLSTESAQLEQRLVTVNRELSLAREFLAAQSRDLEALGRIAAERLSQNAERLQELVRENGVRVDTISGVSTAALENMEKLRGQLPVIASSTKDVTNTIANAGRTAHAQLEDMITGFNRLNESGTVVSQQVETIRRQVGETLEGFTRQCEQLEVIAQQRFAALAAQGEEFRTRLDSHEVDALAAIRTRAAALGEEIEATRLQLEEHEAQSIVSLRARLGALRDESDVVSRAMRSAEDRAGETLRASLAQLRDEQASVAQDISAVQQAALDALGARLAALDHEARHMDEELRESGARLTGETEARHAALRQEVARLDATLGEAGARFAREAESRLAALTSEAERMERTLGERSARLAAAAQERYAALAAEAEQLDRLLRERSEKLAIETEERQARQIEQESHAIARVGHMLGELDGTIAERLERHRQQTAALGERAAAVTAQLGEFEARLTGIAAQTGEAESRLSASLKALTERLTAAHATLVSTDSDVEKLTDDSVRLLELIQASSKHTHSALPEALSVSEDRLSRLESGVGALLALLRKSSETSAEIAGGIGHSGEQLEALVAKLGEAQSAVVRRGEDHAGQLAGLQRQLAEIADATERAAGKARDELAEAIAALGRTLAEAVAAIENDSAARIAAVARKLGDDSGEAMETAMRAKVAEISGQLEQAVAHASGVTREATVQLREQLARVEELVGNLENRVTQARHRAEEQVDNDFSRRVALITESLNSNAIDIAGALSADVADTSWAAYLRGDRGIFTRRAVSLLEAGEIKAIQQLFERDDSFREHVSRYIHDFEAVLRQILSTRDGNALGVTLLSSDMGKLYVALAQGIERLRT